MKKMFFVIALAATSFAVKAQDAPTNVVKLNPLGLIFGSANVAYEKALNEKSSFLIAPQFGGFKLGGVKYSSFGLGAEYRLYLSNSKSAPEGFYAGPGLAFTSGKVKYEGFEEGDEKIKFSSFGGKVILGNQWIFDSGFTIDLNGGISYQKFSYKDGKEDGFGLKASGVLPALGFSIGYAF
jgi:hypothetical protein